MFMIGTSCGLRFLWILQKVRLAIVFLFLALITLATYEVVMVDKVIVKLENQVTSLSEMVKSNKEDLSIVETEISYIKKDWDSKEDNLCLMFNHKDLSAITDSLTKLKSYIYNNDYDNAVAEVDLLNEYARKNRHIMGFNMQNLL